MLVITQSQLNLLNKSAEQNFIKKVVADLRKNKVGVAPELSYDELIERVKVTVNCAKLFGLSSKYSLAMFTEISFIVGPRFYKYPFINRILQNTNIEADHRIKVILKEMDDDRWEDVKCYSVKGDWQDFCEEFTTDV